MIGPQPDVAAERAVIAGILKFGAEAYIDVSDLVESKTFTVDSNQAIFNCLKYIFEADNKAQIDLPLLLSAAKDVGLDNFFEIKEEQAHLKALFNTQVKLENVRKSAGKIKKLQISRELIQKHQEAVFNLSQVSGNESIEKILSVSENPIFEKTTELTQGKTQGVVLMHEGIDEYMDYLESNPVNILGISTGFDRYNEAIGGGSCRQEIDIIAARQKKGKSFLCDNIALYVCENSKIPVLNIDTEMSQKQHWNRIIAHLSGISINEFKTGQYAKNKDSLIKVHEAKKRFKEMPYHYECVVGMSFEDILNLTRRWIIQKVGVDETGKTKDCLIIYDYFKLMNSADITAQLAEHQKLGFQLMELKSLVARYDVPCLSFAQLNRDGINKEDTSSVGFSDRIGMFCSSITFFKEKSAEEIAQDGVNNGNYKLVTIHSRNGPGTEDQDYVSMQFDKDFGRIKEVKSHFEILAEQEKAKGFENESDFRLGDDNG